MDRYETSREICNEFLFQEYQRCMYSICYSCVSLTHHMLRTETVDTVLCIYANLTYSNQSNTAYAQRNECANFTYFNKFRVCSNMHLFT